MAQNVWLEMFDKAMSEKHQMEYLARQIAEQRAARAERASQFAASMDSAEADRKERAAARQQQEQIAIANLLGQGAVRSGEGETPDVTLGGAGLNLPDPLWKAQATAVIRRQEQDALLEQVDPLLGQLSPLERARIKANIIAGRNIADKPSEIQQFSEDITLANDETVDPKIREQARWRAQIMGVILNNKWAPRPSQAHTGGLTALQSLNVAQNTLEGRILTELAQRNLNPKAPDYSQAVQRAVLEITTNPRFTQGVSPDAMFRARRSILEKFQRSRSESGQPDIMQLLGDIKATASQMRPE